MLLAHAAGQHADHGHDHAPRRLKDLLHRHGDAYEHGEGEGHAGVAHAKVDDRRALCKEGEEHGHHRDADEGQHKAVQAVPKEALRGGGVRLFLVLRAEVIGDHGVCADGKADGDRVDEVLDRIDQGEGRHGVLADAGDVVAVHDVVERGHGHGEHHGERHGQHQRQDGPVLHEGLLQRSRPFFCKKSSVSQEKPPDAVRRFLLQAGQMGSGMSGTSCTRERILRITAK